MGLTHQFTGVVFAIELVGKELCDDDRNPYHRLVLDINGGKTDFWVKKKDILTLSQALNKTITLVSEIKYLIPTKSRTGTTTLKRVVVDFTVT